MQKNEFNIDNLKKCIDSLEISYIDYCKTNDEKMREYIKDSCIKRFEYSVETSWKLMKRFLKLKYGRKEQELTVNNIFRLMEGYSFIISWENWRDYYAKRNDTSHEYNQEKAEEILNIIEYFLQDIKYLYERLGSQGDM